MRSISLAWLQNPEPYGISYRISRSEQESGPFTILTETRENLYTDRNVEPKKNYYYLLTVLAANGNQSKTSSLAKATPNTCVPVAPTGLTTQTREWSAILTWQPNPEEFITHYFVYRQTSDGLKMVGKTLKPSFAERSLTPNTTYTYMVAAVSIDEEESPVTSINATTKVATKPPLEITVVEMRNIFSNTYKIYESQGLGKIRVTNNMDDPVDKLKLSFTIKEYMDFPWETEIEALGAGQSQEFVLKAVFNNNILNITEDSPVQTQLNASYYENNQAKTFSRNHTITIFEKHRMMWDLRDRFATFVTPKDPLVLEFVRSVVSQFGASADTIHHAAAVFDALGLLGLTYMQDPTNPYQVTSGKTDLIDYIQYPRETLQRKSGDCDDLVALFSAALESIGVRTLAIEVPGHMFMMLATGIEADKQTDTLNNLFIVHEDQLWLPLETTLVGNPFIKAWEQGSSTYYQWLNKNLTLLDVRTAWGTFKPASLPHSEWRPPATSKSSIEERFPDDFRTIRKLMSRLKSGKLFDQLATNPSDPQTLLQIGIIYARIGEPEEALVLFMKALALDPANAAAQNNAGNAYYVLNRFEEACAAYEMAGENDPTDPQIWVSLARCYRRLSLPDKAKEAFRKASEIEPNVTQQFRTLALELQSIL
jgi:tetratricopeptide (TPR) repeat protein